MSDAYSGSAIPAQAGYAPENPAFLPFTLDFTTLGTLNMDLLRHQERGRLKFTQSVYIDNSNNFSGLTLTFVGTGQVIIAPPLTQGDYPIKIGTGPIRFSAVAAIGQKVSLIFSNMPAQGYLWSTGGNVTIIPFAPLVLVNGNNQLVPGLAGTTVKLWRGMFEVDGPAILKFTDGPGGALLWSVDLTTLGSVSFNQQQFPWFATLTKGNDFTLNSNAVVNLYGGFGYQQS